MIKTGDDLDTPGVSHFRIAFVGDPCSGKSEVRRAYVQLSTAKESIQQVDSNVARVKGLLVELLTVDRESEFEKIPHMSRCSHLDAVILFYDITDPTQFERAHNQWIPLIKRLYQSTPFVICATGIENRLDVTTRESILRAQIHAIRRELADAASNDTTLTSSSSDTSASSSMDSTGTTTAASTTTTSLSSSSTSLSSTATTLKAPSEQKTADGKEVRTSSEKFSVSGGRSRLGSIESVPGSPYVLKRAPLSPNKVMVNPKSKSGFRKLVPSQLGKHLAFHCGASAFKEVSYRTFEGVQELLEETVVHIVRADKVKFSLVRSRIGLPLPRHIYRLS